MGTILGPFDSATWLTLGMLKRDIDYMRGRDADRFRLAIKKQKETYDYILDECA
jgi:hypothetical protein